MKAGEEVGQGGAGRCVLLGVDCVEEATHCMLCSQPISRQCGIPKLVCCMSDVCTL